MKQKIGIWGLGTCGTSLVSFFSRQEVDLQVMDARIPNQQEEAFLRAHKAAFIAQKEKEFFLEQNDIIVASPGIDLRPYLQYADKFCTELDLFTTQWKKPLITVTGSLGKTSIVQLLTQLLNASGRTYLMGGNVGIGMLDLLQSQTTADGAVIELSSFQLERAKQCNPDLAIWTNLYPNHLDRHGTFADYFAAKYGMIKFQEPNKKALLPWEIRELIYQQPESNFRSYSFFCDHPIDQAELSSLKPRDTLYFRHSSTILKQTGNRQAVVVHQFSELPTISYPGNWLILVAAADLMNINFASHISSSLSLPEHRLQFVATVNGITFYNDSKSTVAQATLAAVAQFHTSPVHLLLGGISKGVDRKPLIEQLKNSVAAIYCFGKETETLFDYCQQAQIPAFSCPDLESAFKKTLLQAKSGDIVLLSPAGASYDLFKNYEERGNAFMKLVYEYHATQ